MIAGLRILDTGVGPSRWNIAATAAMMALHGTGSIPDTIRFHRYPRSVLVGRQQDLANEIAVERCRTAGIEMARRVTGGGAVYMSPGILAWDVIAGRYRFGAGLGEVSSRIGSTIAAGLRRLGFPAKVGAPGSIEIDGRKVSGSSGGFEGSTMVLQGTILIDFDREEMAGVLKAPSGLPEPVSRVASLADFLGRVPSVEEVRAALLAEFSTVWRSSMDLEELRPEESLLAQQLLFAEIGTDEFVTGYAAKTRARLRDRRRRNKAAS